MSDQEKTPEAEAMVPSFRLRDETGKRQKAEGDLQAAMQTIKDLQEKHSALEASHTKAQTTHRQDVALLGVGVSDPEVREFIRSRWTPTNDKETFDGWLTEQRENPSPLLRPFLTSNAPAIPDTPAPVAEAAPTPEATTEAEPPPGNPNAGTSQPAAHNGKAWTHEDIVAASRKAGARGGLGDQRDAILAQLRAEGAIR